MIEFFLPMQSPPTTTHQQKKVNLKTGVFYEEEALKKARDNYMTALSKYVPEKPMNGPIRILMKFCFPYPKSWPKKKRKPTWKETKPDWENMVKLPQDCMEHLGFFEKGDQQIASGIVEKFWSEPSGVYIRLEELC